MLGGMVDEPDDAVEIGGDGTLRPLGHTALARLRARAGRFLALPAPKDLLVLRRAPAPGTDARACTLSGEVRSAGLLCDVLSFVGHTGWRGELVVHERDAARSIYFDQGDVVGARSTVPRERLGEVLYRYGVLSREQVASCSEATAAGALRFGEAAVKLGHVGREALFGHMGRQIEEVFYGMLAVEHAMYFFLEGFDDHELAARQKLSVSGLVREGVRRVREAKYFRVRIPDATYVAHPVGGAAPPDGELAQVLTAVDGSRDVTALCRLLARGEFDVTRALFQLVQSGHVVVKPPRLDASASVDVYNRAISLVLRELDARDEGDPVRAQLATFVSERAELRALVAGAGPADDGTLDGVVVARNAAALPPAEGAEDLLARALYDCISYALFLARPQLARSEQKVRLSTRVGALIEPLAPDTAHVAGGDPRADARRRG